MDGSTAPISGAQLVSSSARTDGPLRRKPERLTVRGWRLTRYCWSRTLRNSADERAGDLECFTSLGE